MQPTVTGKRSLVHFYLSLFGMFLFYFLMGAMILGIYVNDYHSDHFQTKEYGLLVMLAAIVFGCIYTVYKLLKSTPSITITDEYIILSGTAFYWDQLENVSISGKNASFLGDKREGVALKFKNQTEQRLIDSRYANIAEIKQFIQHQIIEKESIPALVEPIDQSEIENQQFVIYKGIQFINFRAIIMWLFIVPIAISLISNYNKPGIVIFLLLTAYFLVKIISWYLYYFEVSDNYLVVRNHNLFWRKDIYRLSDIGEIVFEMPNKMPGCMRVITKDFNGKLYRAATLSNKKWNALKDDLERKKIPIRDEFISSLITSVEFKLFD